MMMMMMMMKKKMISCLFANCSEITKMNTEPNVVHPVVCPMLSSLQYDLDKYHCTIEPSTDKQCPLYTIHSTIHRHPTQITKSNEPLL